jgi:serine/threonine protein kinase
MSERSPASCSGCGTDLGTLAIAGRLCPVCLLRAALDEEPDPPDSEADPALDLPAVSPSTTTILSVLGGDAIHTRYLAERGLKRQLVTVGVWRRVPGTEWAPGLFDARARAMATITHPGIVRLLEAGVTPAGDYGLVHDFAEGVSVARYCAVTNATAQQRAAMMTAAGHALAAAHAAGVPHGRISPGAIVVHGDPTAPRVRLVGFALALSPDDGVEADRRALETVAQVLESQNR